MNPGWVIWNFLVRKCDSAALGWLDGVYVGCSEKEFRSVKQTGSGLVNVRIGDLVDVAEGRGDHIC